MSKLFFALSLTFLVSMQVQAQNDKATVYLLRGIGPDEFVPYFTYSNQALLCKLGNGKFSMHEVAPGEHKFHAQYRGKIKSSPEKELVLMLEPGETYYISVNIATKAFSKGGFYCDLVTEEAGKEMMESLILDKKCL